MKIDKAPPAATGDTRADISAIINYLYYLREQLNFMIHKLEREEADQ